MLKLQQAENQDEQGQLLQSMLDDANSRKNELESENRYTKKQDFHDNLQWNILKIDLNLILHRHQFFMDIIIML